MSQPKPYVWGKKFCHEPSLSKLGTMLDVIHISGRSTTLCGTAMLGNNYADQDKDEVSCIDCVREYNLNMAKKLKKQLNQGSNNLIGGKDLDPNENFLHKDYE